MAVAAQQSWATKPAIAGLLLLQACVLAIVAQSNNRNQTDRVPSVVHATPSLESLPSVRQMMAASGDPTVPEEVAASNEAAEVMAMSQTLCPPTWHPITETNQRISASPPKADASSTTTQNLVSSSKRPHIVMVVIDDMGYADLGFKGSGIRTPTIDRLVASGTRLTNYYVLPACTHTRIALMSGKYPYRAGIYKVLQARSQKGMNTKDATLANVLASRGYRAHAVGKWHLGHAWNDYLPTFRGFHSFFGCWLNKDHFNHTVTSKGDNVEAYDLHWETRDNCGRGCSRTVDYRGKYSTTIFTDRAVEIIKTIDPSPNEPPLFLYLGYQALHTPLQVPPKYRKLYKSKKGWKDKRKVYAGMLTAIDDGIAAIVKTLQEQGLWENTLMILTTDNGAPGGQGGSNTPLRGGKMQTFEGAIRADGMIVGPASKKLGILPGTNPRLFHAVDWMPTLTDLSDSVRNAPKVTDWANLDGISQVRSLRGGTANRLEAFLGYDYYDTTNTGLAFRSNELKLIRMKEGQYELYNLTNDISESKNLLTTSQAQAYATRVSHMKRRIQWYQSQFTAKAPSLGACPRRQAYGTTPWNKPLLIPWCNAELDKMDRVT